jgi:hypothetical protein
MKNNAYRVFIHKNVTDVFHKYRTRGIPEAGGILLGQIRKNEIYILKVTEPSRWDIRQMFGFVRARKQAQKAIDMEFEKSEGRTIYLGEWHSHPEANPTPSSVDTSMIERQFRKNDINENFLIMMIVGYNQDYCSIYDGKKLISGKYSNSSRAMKEVIFPDDVLNYQT